MMTNTHHNTLNNKYREGISIPNLNNSFPKCEGSPLLEYLLPSLYKKNKKKGLKKGALDDPGDLVLIMIMVIVAYLLMNLMVTESVKSAEQSSARALAAGNNMASDIARAREMVQQEELFPPGGFTIRSIIGGRIIDLYEMLSTHSFTAMGTSTWKGGREKSLLALRYQGKNQEKDLDNQGNNILENQGNPEEGS